MATLPANTGSIFIARSPIVSWQSGQVVLMVIAALLTRPDFCRDAFTSNLARPDRPGWKCISRESHISDQGPKRTDLHMRKFAQFYNMPLSVAAGHVNFRSFAR
jgi:hypothetical protein